MFRKLLTISLLITAAWNTRAASFTTIDEKNHHLGNDVVKQWKEAPAEPGGFDLRIRFQFKTTSEDRTLGLTHRDVDNRWDIKLNGKAIGQLERKKERREYLYELPAGILKDGENVLHIFGRRTQDDITVGNARIYDASIRQMLNLHPVTVSVTDPTNGKFLPAKITFADQTNGLIEVFYAESPKTAVRRGIVYTLGTPTKCELPSGSYRVYASRGTEWSLQEKSLNLTAGGAPSLQFQLKRELETTGYVAADTHIHTLTFSGHGDSSVEERMVTLAAEGVELAIATDHNHQTDFRPYQSKLGLNDHFTSVTGNEVTTKNGHFNSFPLRPGKDVPPYKEEDWVKLVDGIRAKGAKVVILNHPSWPDIARGPFGRFGLNRASGDRAKGGPFTFDALELINSGTLQPDPLFICRDWFALLNNGEQITAVGSSDSHTVGNIVGQGRTYVRSSTDDPARIDVNEACKAFLAGDTSISMGIIATATVNGQPHGKQVRLTGKPAVKLRVQAPSWIRPQRAIVYLNGEAVTEQLVPSVKPGTATDLLLTFDLPRLVDDGWLVCVVLGPGVKNPAWATEQNYTFAATNPIYLDADLDGIYSNPRATAIEKLQKAGTKMDQIWSEIMSARDPIAIQMISHLRLKADSSRRADLDARIKTAAAKRKIFSEFLRYAPK